MKSDIRTYIKEDKTEVLNMMSDFYDIESYSFDRAAAEQNLSLFSSKEDLGQLFIVEVETRIAGYLILTFGFSFEYQGRDAFIDEFYIKPGFRNQGIGKQTLTYLEDQAAQLGVRAVHLEVERTNATAQKLYVNHGFRANERILMTKRL